MTVVDLSPKGHKHNLAEHIESVKEWFWLNIEQGYGGGGEQARNELFIAYERWLNDRELLTTEDPSQVAQDRRNAEYDRVQARKEYERKNG